MLARGGGLRGVIHGTIAFVSDPVTRPIVLVANSAD